MNTDHDRVSDVRVGSVWLIPIHGMDSSKDCYSYRSQLFMFIWRERERNKEEKKGKQNNSFESKGVNLCHQRQSKHAHYHRMLIVLFTRFIHSFLRVKWNRPHRPPDDTEHFETRVSDHSHPGCKQWLEERPFPEDVDDVIKKSKLLLLQSLFKTSFPVDFKLNRKSEQEIRQSKMRIKDQGKEMMTFFWTKKRGTYSLMPIICCHSQVVFSSRLHCIRRRRQGNKTRRRTKGKKRDTNCLQLWVNAFTCNRV